MIFGYHCAGFEYRGGEGISYTVSYRLEGKSVNNIHIFGQSCHAFQLSEHLDDFKQDHIRFNEIAQSLGYKIVMKVTKYERSITYYRL